MLKRTPILRKSPLKRTGFKRFAKPGALSKSLAWLQSKRKPIRKISAKKRKAMIGLAKIRKEKVSMFGDSCAIQIHGVCTGTAQGLHHIQKQSQGGEHTHDNTMLACNACNRWVEDNPTKAESIGLVSRRKRVA